MDELVEEFDDHDPVQPFAPAGLRSLLGQKVLAPALLVASAFALWESLVRYYAVPVYLLPTPSLIAKTLVADWGTLSGSLAITATITMVALVAAALLGGALAILFSQSRWIEASFFPFAVVLQVTPIVAIAPLIIIWVKDTRAALLICAWLVAFFPVLSNATLGLNSADHNLCDLFRLYRASSRQTLWRLRIPAAMPYYLGGLRISGGLSLIGAIVAEFVAGSGGVRSGLADRILESGYQLNIPRMFAALAMVSVTGVIIFLGLSILSHLVLRRWHESAIRGDH